MPEICNDKCTHEQHEVVFQTEIYVAESNFDLPLEEFATNTAREIALLSVDILKNIMAEYTRRNAVKN